MANDELRARYKELKALSDAAYEAAEPQRAALRDAEQPYDELEEQICELLDGAEVNTCEVCSEPIFEGEKTGGTSDGCSICEKCAPTYQDILDDPAHFTGADDEPMTPAEAKELCDAHIAAGGSLHDTTAT